MARSKSPCGTYAAYQRHLREETPVDPACRAAQQDHDRGRSRRLTAVARPPAGAPVLSVSPAQACAAARRAFREAVATLAELAAGDDLYAVIDNAAVVDELLEAWCGAADEAASVPEEARTLGLL